jgi:hypothetical protein
LKLIESLDCAFQWVAAAPVQKIAIQPLGPETSERSLGGRNRPASGSILGKDLGNQEDVIAPAGDCLADYFLGSAIHLCSVDMGHAAVDS